MYYQRTHESIPIQFRLIITDVDGTITKNEVKGFVGGNLSNLLPMSMNGMIEVHHANVVRFFDVAAKNGYTIIYLTARPIDFDSQTRKYLFESMQNRDGGYSLPLNPLFSGHKVEVDGTSAESYDPGIVKTTMIRTILDLFELKEKVRAVR